LVKTEKGDISKALRKGRTVGDCVWEVPVNPIVESFRHNNYDWNLINLLVGRAIPIMK